MKNFLSIDWDKIKICVLQPDYSTTNVDYKNYDPVRDLSTLIPNAHFENVLINKLTTYRQLKELKYKNFDIFVNLCEGYLEWKIPSIDVIFNLDLLNLPYTGSTINLYDPSKKIMKYVAFCQDIQTPNYIYINATDSQKNFQQDLDFPLFLKPAKAGDSLGIDEKSLVFNKTDLEKKANLLLQEFDDILIEEFIEGREFTCLVFANPDGKTCTALEPIEYIFPEGFSYKTYSLKTSELHPNANIPCNDPNIATKIKNASEKIFLGFNGKGYARLDYRLDKNNSLYFLEINFACSIFYTDGMEGSADFILQFDPIGKSGFLKKMIEEGIARFQRKQKLYELKRTSLSGYGIYATEDITPNTIIFRGEGKAQRIITKDFINNNWNEQEKMDFKRYAYPLSEKYYLLWDLEPTEWAPQNHSCDPNTKFIGLDVYSLKFIKKGEELTIDYAEFLDHTMQPFECNCRAANCRGLIKA